MGSRNRTLFYELYDIKNNTYFAYDFISAPRKAKLANITGKANICSFLSERLTVTPLASSRFSTDLTSHDDLILAVISLLLLLLIEATLTAVLLKTSDGAITNFSFSVKHFVDLAKDFRFRHLFRGKRNDRSKPRCHLNRKLLVTALLVLSTTLGLEVLVLYFTSPHSREVSNSQASFELRPVTMPDWNPVSESVGTSSISRPCTTVSLSGVEQGITRLSACITSSLTVEDADAKFQLIDGPVDVKIQSDLHELGVEHMVQIGGEAANYSARAYFSLDDRKSRIMRARKQVHNRDRQLFGVHLQLVAFLFNIYMRETGDKSVSLDDLNKLKPKFNADPGPPVNIIQVNGEERFRQVISVRHTTEISSAAVPGGTAALSFAQQVFKGASAIAVGGPDWIDVTMSTGNNQGKETVIWREDARTLNWLSLLLLLLAAFALFAVLRFVFRPVGTAEIAAVFVATGGGGTVQVPDVVRKTFSAFKTESVSGSEKESRRRKWWKTSSEGSSCGSDDLSTSRGTESLRDLPF